MKEFSSITETLYDIAAGIRYLEEDLSSYSKTVRLGGKSCQVELVGKSCQVELGREIATAILDDFCLAPFREWLAAKDGFTVWRLTQLRNEIERFYDSILHLEPTDDVVRLTEPGTEFCGVIEDEPNDESSWYFVADWIETMAGPFEGMTQANQFLAGQQLKLFTYLKEHDYRWVSYGAITHDEIVRGDDDSVKKALERVRSRLNRQYPVEFGIEIEHSNRRARLLDNRPSPSAFQEYTGDK